MKEFKGRGKLCTALGLALGLALAGTGGIAAADKPAVQPAVIAGANSANTAALANQILDRWQAVAQQAGAASPAWREIFGTQFSRMSVSALQAIDALNVSDANNAKADYAQFEQAVRNAILQTYMLGGYGKPQTKLGSSTNDQIFVPIVPCRVVDTRNVGGPILAGFARNFYFWTNNGGFSWASQGGQPFPSTTGAGTSCPGTVDPNTGVPSAAVMTVTAVNPTAAGNYVVWGGASPIPTASVLNWSTGQTLANTTVVPYGGRSGSGPGGPILDFAVYYNGPSGSADFLGDVVGYFVENRPTALDCTTTSGTNSFLGIVSSSCPGGYTMTGGGCTSNSIHDHTYDHYPDSATSWTCAFWPEATFSLGTTLTAYARCCRVPGL